MARHPLGTVLRQMRRLLTTADERAVSDRQLLERFAEQHDESAFETLVQRHGPMVLGVCRRVLAEAHDADDAFQATFLVLVRKAGSLPWRETIAPWLWQVAHRVALKARSNAVRRRTSEREAGEMAALESQSETTGNLDRRELRAVLDEELQKLPDKYRAPLVLCYLEGKTHQEAAGELGWPRGSLAKRVVRAEELLRERLVGRGISLSVGLSALLATERAATAALPPVLLADTLGLAAADAAINVSSEVTYLAEGVIQTMNLSKWKVAAVALVLIGLLGGSLGILWQPGQAADPVKPKPPADPVQVKTDKSAVVKGNTEFALDLYGRLRTQEGNLFLSPYSVSTALAMTSAGARENTLSQMEKTLRFPVEQDRLHPAFGALIGDTKAGKGYQLSVANALWCQVNFPIRDEFLTTNEKHYGGKPTGVDFGKTEEARQTINQWVEQRTQDKIKELLKPGILDKLTRVVLTNAIYFKGDWADKFKKEDTHDAPFLAAGGKKVNVPLMSQTAEFPTLREADFAALELPYAGKELSMVVFLPRQSDGLADFEKSLTAEKLHGWLGKLKPQKINVLLPRFQVKADFRLDEQLKAMGMSDAFSRTANFAGINGKKDDLYIGAVVHQAFVDVNEEGTEAAAATAVVIRTRSEPPQFRADHPFFFLIRDQRTGSILFMGRLVEPK
jgi:serpin B